MAPYDWTKKRFPTYCTRDRLGLGIEMQLIMSFKIRELQIAGNPSWPVDLHTKWTPATMAELK